MKKLLVNLLLTAMLMVVGTVTAAADNITVGGQSRSYNVYAPKNLGQNRPLFILCHGYNQDANWLQNSEFKNENVSMEAVADTAKFVVVFPNGIDRAWDINGDRDINFIKAIIDKMAQQYNIDRNRVYMGGFSMGGMLTYHAMRKIPNLIAAYAPISGPLNVSPAPNSRPLPLIHTHGTADNFQNVQPALNVWINHNGCPTTAKVQTNYNGLGLATRRTWGPGKNGVSVVLIELKGKGHWVSKEPQVYTGNEIWKFCSQYSLDTDYVPEEKKVTVSATTPSVTLSAGFTEADALPSGWSTFDSEESRTGYGSGYSQGCRVLKFTGSPRGLDYGLYIRNKSGADHAGWAKYGLEESGTRLVLPVGHYKLQYKVCNWNNASFNPVEVVVETRSGKQVASAVYTPTVNIGNVASNSFGNLAQQTMEFAIAAEGDYVVAVYAAAAGWSDCIIGQLVLTAKDFDAVEVEPQPAAQQKPLSANPDKFLGNITTDWPGSMDYDGFRYADYWNQVTPENGTKWSTVEGTRNSFYWGGADPAFNYAKNNGFPFKFHTLVWGSQFPGWLKNLSAADRYKAIVNWMDKVKAKYPNLEMIDVVNEAVEGHQADTHYISEALGGPGKTGYDWIIKAFEMAYERWPNAILIYNDFNTFRHNTDQYIDLVRTLRNAGAPVDAYGCQSHDLGGMNQADFRTVMTKIQTALKMPMYITEYDIADKNDGNQKWNFQQHFPVMWEADYCAGVTLWGWFYGKTWLDDEATGEKGISGLIKNKVERSALTWLRDYMATDKARTAKSPFPGMKKEASLYVAPDSLRLMLGNTTAVRVRAALRTKTIRQVQLYAGSTLLGTKTSAPFDFSYTPTAKGTVTLKAVLTATDGSTYERLSAVDVKTPLGVAQRYTSLAQIGSKPFAIVDEQQQKAIYGKDLQNLGFDGYDTAFDDRVSGYYFKLESLSNSSDAAVRNCYLLRLYRPDGSAYTIWGNPGYLNSQPVDQTCCFILGLNKQNGQDMKNGAVWEIQYVEGKGFTLKNRATGKYLQDAAPAKYDTPTYFTFATVGATDGTTGIAAHSALSALQSSSSATYTLDGRRVTGTFRPGIYVRGGRKVIVR